MRSTRLPRGLHVHPFPSLAALALAFLAGESIAGKSAALDPSDLAAVRAVHESKQHAVVREPDGCSARTPSQRWSTEFDGREFRVRPDDGAWSWGLALEQYGFVGSEHVACHPAREVVDGGRIAYDWDSTLQEWWVNSARGLEHGFTLHARPSGSDSGLLGLTLAVRGDLAPRVSAHGRDVVFVDEDGVAVVTYSGLVVFDAEGRHLEARFESVGAQTLRLWIDEQDAIYPLTIDPIAQQAYIKASNTGAGDNFGWVVSASGGTVVVGAPMEDSAAAGNPSDNSATNAGAAYVYVRSGATWAHQATLKASNVGAGDRFGISVSVSGDTIVVGADYESSNATGVNGNELDNSSSFSGAAYVFVRSGTTWTQQAYLKASNTGPSDAFGHSVSVSGDRLAVGAHSEASNATGVNGDETNNSFSSSGAAYVFVRSGTTWTQEAYVKASNTGPSDLFGIKLSLSGDTLVVGAFQEASNSPGVNGDGSNNAAPGSGAAYVFVRVAGVWSQQAYLKASNPEIGDTFGDPVSVWGDTIVVGASVEDSNATGVNGNQANNSAPMAGAAYVFARTGTTWSQQAYLKASNAEANDLFGYGVSAWEDMILVGAYGESSAATGVGGSQSNGAPSSGAAYLFRRVGTTWSQQTYFKASNTALGDQFGWAVALSGDTVVVGARQEDSGALLVNGNQANNSELESGAVYTFNAHSGPVAFCFGNGSGTACPCGNAGIAGNGCASSVNANGANLTASGGSSIGLDTFVLLGTGMPESFALYFQGTAQTNSGLGTVFGDGLRCAGGTTVRLGTKGNVSGASQYPVGADAQISIAGSNGVGDVRTYQVWYRNAADFCTTSTFNLTNGIQTAWGP